MKIINKLFKTAVVLSITALVFSCTKPVEADSTPKTSILEMAKSQPNLTYFLGAVQITGLESALSDAGSSTVFAPTDDAFKAYFAANGIQNFVSIPIPVLKQILLNHVVSGALKNTDFVNNTYIKTSSFGNASLTNPLSMYVTNANNVIKLNNNATIAVSNLTTNNGILHIVDRVITLPRMLDLINPNPNFTTLASLLKRTGQPDFTATPYLGTATSVTVFAPTNAAFTSLNTELLPGGTASVLPADITKVLKYHFVAGNVVSNTLMMGTLYPTLLTSPATSFGVNTTIGTTLLDIHVPQRACKVSATDIQANNGIIHVLDRVMLPF